MGNQVLFSWKGVDRVSFASLLDALNDWSDNGVIVVLDETQELVKARGFNVLPVLAYAYDNLRRVRFIISGSKMGCTGSLRLGIPSHLSSVGPWALLSCHPLPGSKPLNS